MDDFTSFCERCGAPPAVMALISHDGKSWSYIPCDVKDGRISVRTRSLSTFAVFGCHPVYPVLLGITVISALSYYVYKNLDQEIPQRFHSQAPFVALLNPLEVPGAGTGHLYFAWSKSLGTDKGTGAKDVYCCEDLTSDFNKGVLVDQSGVTAGLSTGNSGDYGRRSNSKRVRWIAGPGNLVDPYISDLPESYKRLVVAVSVSANDYPNTSRTGWGAIYYEYVLKKK